MSTSGLRRDLAVVEQCIRGESLISIGQEQGFVSPGPTVRLIDRALESALPHLDARAQRRIDGARLDRLLATWWPGAVEGDLTATQTVLAILNLRLRLEDPDRVEAFPTNDLGSGSTGSAAAIAPSPARFPASEDSR